MVRAVMTGPGWVVEASLDGRPFSKRCGSWQSVERTVYWLRRHAGGQPPALAWNAVAAAVTLIMLLSSAATPLAQAQGDPSPAVRQFMDATREYAALHRQLESRLPRLEVTSHPDTISAAVQAMAAAVRAARPAARPGDVFTEALAPELRARIAVALAAHGFTADDVRAAEAAEGLAAPGPPLHVNESFPWRYATSLFPCILDALPPLPPELQYRIVGNTLVLVDLHADLIVDLLPYALADTER
jgi:hypothetical protein